MILAIPFKLYYLKRYSLLYPTFCLISSARVLLLQRCEVIALFLMKPVVWAKIRFPATILAPRLPPFLPRALSFVFYYRLFFFSLPLFFHFFLSSIFFPFFSSLWQVFAAFSQCVLPLFLLPLLLVQPPSLRSDTSAGCGHSGAAAWVARSHK